MGRLLNNTEAADYLRLSPRTLNNSRYTGLLAGVKAPPYRKIGKVVRYEQNALDEWLEQFDSQSKTKSQPKSLNSRIFDHLSKTKDMAGICPEFSEDAEDLAREIQEKFGVLQDVERL